MTNILFKELSYTICGLLFKVHNELGCYRNEKQYADFLENLLKEKGLHYERELRLGASFEGEKSGRNICDFVIENKIIIELKAKRIVEKDDYFQIK